MNTISVQDVLRDLLSFFQRVEAGESFLVVRGKQPLAEVRPVTAQTAQPRPFGLCAGQFTVPPNFDQPLLDSIPQDFEGP